MAAQKGFIYEENTAAFLKPAGIVPQNFTPAGAGHDQPDLMIQFQGQEAGLELKINQASFGSLVLHFYREQQLKGNNPWSWGSIGPDEKEKLFLQDLGTRLKVLDEIAKNWTKTPHLIQDRQKLWNTPQMRQVYTRMGPRGRYNFDKKNFEDFRLEISASEIESYYNLKDTYYIQVGTHGFFLLGDKDPLKLNRTNAKRGMKPIPKFSNSCSSTARIRCQSKGVTKAEQKFVQTGDMFGPNGYQFTFELQVKGLKKSPYNIAPLAARSVVPNADKATLEFLQ